MIEWLLRICSPVWKTNKVPNDWKKGVCITLPKNGDLTIFSNNRGITLLSNAGKVFRTMTLLRIGDAIDKRLKKLKLASGQVDHV